MSINWNTIDDLQSVQIAQEPRPIVVLNLPEYISRNQLTEILHCHRNTLRKLDKIARIFITDYRESTTTQMPLSRYQCWVLTKLLHFSRNLRNDELVKKLVKANASNFSQWEYIKTQRRG